MNNLKQQLIYHIRTLSCGACLYSPALPVHMDVGSRAALFIPGAYCRHDSTTDLGFPGGYSSGERQWPQGEFPDLLPTTDLTISPTFCPLLTPYGLFLAFFLQEHSQAPEPLQRLVLSRPNLAKEKLCPWGGGISDDGHLSSGERVAGLQLGSMMSCWLDTIPAPSSVPLLLPTR